MNLILIFLLLSTLYIGDSYTLIKPGYVGNTGERLVSWHVGDSILALQETPKYYYRVVVELGFHAVDGSDRAHHYDPALFQRRYGQLLDTALEHGYEVVAINIPWSPRWDEKPRKLKKANLYNQMVAQEAARRGVYVVDAWTLLYECGMQCICEDNAHPNQQGFDLIANALPPMPTTTPAWY